MVMYCNTVKMRARWTPVLAVGPISNNQHGTPNIDLKHATQMKEVSHLQRSGVLCDVNPGSTVSPRGSTVGPWAGPSQAVGLGWARLRANRLSRQRRFQAASSHDSDVVTDSCENMPNHMPRGW